MVRDSTRMGDGCASNPSTSESLHDAPGVGRRTPACLRGQRELDERLHALARDCWRDADCTIVRLRCSAEANCGYPVRQPGDGKHEAVRTLDRDLACDCGPCFGESVSCPARVAVCCEGRCVGAEPD